eukprot:6595876-Pyramimonas_sp.AAC.1
MLPRAEVSERPPVLAMPDEEYIATQPPEEGHNNQYYEMVAVDCEMSYTCRGLELTRATFLDTKGE